MRTRINRLGLVGWGVALAVSLGTAALVARAGAARSGGPPGRVAAGAGARPGPGGPGPAAPAPATPAADATDTEGVIADEGHRLLSDVERSRGATYPGRDPAYVVLPRPPERRETSRELLALTGIPAADGKTTSVAEMTRRMMDYILTSRAADGSWSDTGYPSNTGVTGLCCLAIMAGGDGPHMGPNGKALSEALEYLMKCAHDSGAITGQGSNPMGPMYEQCYATLALLYAYGQMPWRRDLRNVISKSLQLIERSQKLDGGWRYNFSREGDSDVSVTCNVLWVLRTGKKCGFTVSAERIRNAVAFIERCGLPYGGFRYRFNGRPMTPSMGGAGIIVLVGDGSLDHPLIPVTRDRIEYDYRRYTVEDLMERRYTIFNTFFASLAMYMCGDEYWVPWYKKVVRLYARMQRRDGEVYDQAGAVVYPTAMAATVLQAPLGYLPIYER